MVKVMDYGQEITDIPRCLYVRNAGGKRFSGYHMLLAPSPDGKELHEVSNAKPSPLGLIGPEEGWLVLERLSDYSRCKAGPIKQHSKKSLPLPELLDHHCENFTLTLSYI